MTEPESKINPVSSTSNSPSTESSAGGNELSIGDSDPKEVVQDTASLEIIESETKSIGGDGNDGSDGQNNGSSESDSGKLNDDDHDWEWDPDEMEILLAEAKALNEYLARHGGESMEQVNANSFTPKLVQGHSDLIDSIAAATRQASAKNWKNLSKVYSSVSGATYQKQKVSGKSILDTLNGRRRFFSKKNIPVWIGVGFFVLALIIEYMVAWTGRVSGSGEELEGTYRFIIYHATLNLAPFVVPAIWGAIGACVFLSKRISDHLYAMSYEVNKMQGIAPRIFLGAILGFITVYFLFDTNEALKPVAVGDVKIGAIVAAFVAGLSVKPIYRGFEALSEGISKRFSPDKGG